MADNIVTINGMPVPIAGERNLLDLIRKVGIEMPTFCYHSELSVYGACRLCVVEVEGRGVMASCSTPPEPGMVVRTETKEIREFRKINVELLLANHNRECPTCVRSYSCALQDIARRLGVEDVRFKQTEKFPDVDRSSPSLTRDPSKCVLCGDCVRVCKEVQGVGAIDFTHRGAKAMVAPAFQKGMGDVECVNCGQCAAVCPTGAITPKQDVDGVWDALYDQSKTVVVQVAPAVRVALGEFFGYEPGTNVDGRLVAALKLLGFKQVFDTSFAADMTIFEEATELLERAAGRGRMPLFTSCCPAWVKYAEINFPELLPNISTCKSPQQMFGAIAKEALPAQLGVRREDLVVVSIMPCTAKKHEAKLKKFVKDGAPDVDYVITTIEAAKMINSVGLKFRELEPEAFDMPFGFATGAGFIFGATGGVMEAALRFAVEKLDGGKLRNVDFKEVRGERGRKEAAVAAGGKTLRVAVVHGLANAKRLAEEVRDGKAPYDFIEVMACPGGCVCGAGQPIQHDKKVRAARASGLYHTDKRMQLQKSQDNYFVKNIYAERFGGAPGSHKAHDALHTRYSNRSMLFDARVPLLRGTAHVRQPVIVAVCGDAKKAAGQETLERVLAQIRSSGWEAYFDVDAAFSAVHPADPSVSVSIGDDILGEGDAEAIAQAIEAAAAVAITESDLAARAGEPPPALGNIKMVYASRRAAAVR